MDKNVVTLEAWCFAGQAQGDTRQTARVKRMCAMALDWYSQPALAACRAIIAGADIEATLADYYGVA